MKIFTREFILKILRTVLEFEKDTLKLYQDSLDRLTDDRARIVFSKLRDDEERHVASVVELIEDLI